jgi:hypothetical protein
MTGKIYHPENKHPEPYQEDLNPDAAKGLNYGEAGAPMPTRTAHDVKDVHVLLRDFTDDELQQMPVLCEGVRLETGAAYVNLADDLPHEIHALGDEDVGPEDRYLAKKDVPYELWNRLLGIEDPNRTKQPPPKG